MILVTGGKYEGEEDFIREHWPEKTAFFGLAKILKEKVSSLNYSDAVHAASSFAEEFFIGNEDSVVFLPETGCGIIPIDESDRIFREAIGRAGCVLAEKADEVYVVTMGIGQKIK